MVGLLEFLSPPSRMIEEGIAIGASVAASEAAAIEAAAACCSCLSYLNACFMMGA